MNLTLSWDLFVIVFFALIITYSFIIGKHESVKIVVASYIAIVAVQGIGVALDRLQQSSQSMFDTLGLGFDVSILSTTKIVLFIAAIIIIAVKGGVEIVFQRESGTLLDLVFTGFFGFTTAGLLLSTLVTYVANAPILSKGLVDVPTVATIIKASPLMSVLILNQDIWFALPAVLLLIVGLMTKESA